MFDFDDLEERLPEERRVRVWAISDVHTDMRQNMQWITGLDADKHAHDVLILAGDISNKWDDISETLTECKRRFSRVFFVPGNHDLWVRKGKSAQEDSMQRLRNILELCKSLGVETAPSEVSSGSIGVFIVPLLAWHHPQWDTEPEIEGWDGILQPHQVASDYMLTKWPEPLRIEDGSVARALDAVNDEIFDMAELTRRRGEHAALLSFSHFLPRLEVNPEKRYLTQPQLAKVVGSNYLRERVEQLRPDVHVFGHTHFGYDMVVDGVRYVQAPLAYPMEREARCTTVAVDQFPVLDPRPCLIWDSVAGWAPPHKGAWSEYYIRYGRRPEVTQVLPAYVANSLTPTSPSCRVGWIRGRMPAWLFGPQEHRKAEARRVVEGVRGLMSSGKQRDAAMVPRAMEVAECRQLLAEGRCTVIDVRRDAERPMGGRRIPGSVALPHPSLTENFPGLPDEELLAFCERLMAADGPLVLVGAGASSDCTEPAVLLAHLLRLWPQDMRVLMGGVKAWLEQQGQAG